MEERMAGARELATRCQGCARPLYLPTVSRISGDLVDLADRLRRRS